jgi:hypothetical protein
MRRKKRTDDAAAFEKLMWERQYLGGRFPEPSEEASADAQPPPEQPSTQEAPPGPEPIQGDSQSLLEGDRRGRGKRSDKVTGLHIVLQQIQRDGFPHPATGGFLMVPRVIKALLCLEPLAVIQVVFEIFEQTVGWEDKKGLHGRREWARLPLRHFELACGMDNMQVLRGLKRAMQRGYILRRPRLDSFEYAIRWADSPPRDSEKDSLKSL